MSKPPQRVAITRASSGSGDGAVEASADIGCHVWGTMCDVEGNLPTAEQAVVATSGDLGGVPSSMTEVFAGMLASAHAPDPQLLVDAYLAPAAMPAGACPPRTTVGTSWAADALHAVAQPLQDRVLQELQLVEVLVGAHA